MTKIMFNDKYGLTEAVLNGKKTQTRRVFNATNADVACIEAGETAEIISIYSRYKVGEVVAVAQAYKDIPSIANTNFVDVDWDRASKNKPFGKWGCASKLPGWKNKMFVRADQMPHHIRITNIRVERLQDISDEDCMAEGIYEVMGGFDETNYAYKGIGNSMFGTARCAYMSLIAKVCGRSVWDENPYVFVYDFVKED